MTRRLLAFGATAVAALVVLVIVLAAVPDRRELALQVYAFGLCAIVVLWLLGGPGRPRRGLRVRRGAPRRAARRRGGIDLARVEREVTLGVANAYDLHYRLRPRLRAIVTSRLADRRGIDVERQPEAAQAAVEPVVWELVRPDRQPPHDRHGPGLGLPRLREVMEGLDHI